MITGIKVKMSKELQAALKDPASLFRKRFSAGIQKSAQEVQRETRKNVIPGWNIGHNAGPGSAFTGRLNRSITYAMVTPLKAIIGANTPYAAMQEYGGDITPKTAKALFVPMSSRGRKVGPVKGGGSGLLYIQDFIFMQKVTIKPKSYFERGINTAINRIKDIMDGVLNDSTKDMGFK